MGLQLLPNAIYNFIEVSEYTLYVLLSPIILFISGVIILVSSPKLSFYIASFSEAEEGGMEITASEKTMRIVLIVMGIYFFAGALPQFAQKFTNMSLFYKEQQSLAMWVYLIDPILSLIVAAVLIIYPDKIAALTLRNDVVLDKTKDEQK